MITSPDNRVRRKSMVSVPVQCPYCQSTEVIKANPEIVVIVANKYQDRILPEGDGCKTPGTVRMSDGKCWKN